MRFDRRNTGPTLDTTGSRVTRTHVGVVNFLPTNKYLHSEGLRPRPHAPASQHDRVNRGAVPSASLKLNFDNFKHVKTKVADTRDPDWFDFESSFFFETAVRHRCCAPGW